MESVRYRHPFIIIILSTPNERVWCTTQLAKLSFNHSIGRTHSWGFHFFNKIITFYFPAQLVGFNLSDLLTKAVVTGVDPSHPRYVPSLLSRIGFRIPTARRFSSNVAHSRFPLINFYARKSPNEHEYVCALGENWTHEIDFSRHEDNSPAIIQYQVNHPANDIPFGSFQCALWRGLRHALSNANGCDRSLRSEIVVYHRAISHQIPLFRCRK